MRSIGTLPLEDDALRFIDHLSTLGISAELRPAEGGLEVWVHDEGHVQRSRDELRSFLENPRSPVYLESQRKAKLARDAYEEASAGSNVIDVRTRWNEKTQEVPALTFTLIAICVLVAMVTQLGEQMEPHGNRLTMASIAREGDRIRWFGLSEIRGGQVWRVFTPIFLHFGILHLFFNMYWLKELGGQIETRRGLWVLAGLVFASAAVSNLTQYLWSDPYFGGMSGVLYALFGYIWMHQRHEPGGDLEIHHETVRLMLVWLCLCMTGLLGPVANAAHVGGLAFGVAVGSVPYWLGRLRRR